MSNRNAANQQDTQVDPMLEPEVIAPKNKKQRRLAAKAERAALPEPTRTKTGKGSKKVAKAAKPAKVAKVKTGPTKAELAKEAAAERRDQREEARRIKEEKKEAEIEAKLAAGWVWHEVPAHVETLADGREIPHKAYRLLIQPKQKKEKAAKVSAKPAKAHPQAAAAAAML